MKETNHLSFRTEVITRCYHCGEECKDEILHFDDKEFCCQGCQTVYEILSENGMCNYYDLSQNPGIKLKNRDFGDKFAYLDNTEIARRLLSFASDDLNKVTLFLPAIHCSSCIWLLENLYKLRDGITYSRVNFVRKEISLSFNPQVISFRQVAELLTTLGYEPQINLQDLKQKQQNNQNRNLIYKIGVTGFCFGNIMLFSFPDYLAWEDWVDMHRFLGYLNILLALPIFFYSSSDYYRSAIGALRAKTINLDVPITLGIFAIFGRSLYEILTLTGAGYMDSLAALLFFLLTGKWFQSKTYESLSFERDYKSYFPLAVTVKNPKTEQTDNQTVTSLKKNDVILIRNRELVPADSILLTEKAFIDYSFVTGEAKPVEKIQGDYIYAGGRQMGSTIELAVQKEVQQSYLTQLWNSEVFNKPKVEKVIRHSAFVSKYFTYVTLIIAFGSFGFWYFVNPAVMWNAFTAVLIVACPCALALSMPYGLGNTTRIFGRNKFYLKNAEVVAHLAEINHLVFDKTGTITQNEQAEIEFVGNELTSQEKSYIKSLAVHSTHPFSKKIAEIYQNIPSLTPEYFKEVEGKGIYGRIAGIALKMGSKRFVEDVDSQVHHEDNLQSRVYIQWQNQLLGYFKIQNQYRPDLKDIVKELQNEKVDISVVTGDNHAELLRLQGIFGSQADLRFHQTPQDKLEYVKNLQNQKKEVLMLGDGLNDAGALKQSDVGIAITEDTTSFSPACDAILDASAFGQLNKFIKFSKVAINIVKMSFFLSFMYNIVGLSFAVSGNLSPVLAAILMPLSSITVVGFIILMTNWYAMQWKLLK
ncbi:MAG: heavy metal translocating P-type ATPase metal-binding domain-containing protein [Microscillaceae bacterium]|jgi:Cu+-exporting ATPase|nr:heavy metal translocating P-type ATPase metal-binding domain-containing protein [Microscillaceae bacterium]